MRLSGPSKSITEKQEIVRKRVFDVSSLDEVADVLEVLKRERFVGAVRFNVGPGGRAISVEAEERARV
jgi:hypothetical protein